MFKNPWWVVVGSVFGLLVGNGAIMQFTFGVLLKPIGQEFGWDRGTVSMAMVIGLVCTGLMTPLIGILVDRYGIRRIALPCIAAFSAIVALTSLTPASPLAFIAFYGVMGLAASGQTPLIYSKSIAASFDDHRGLALGVAMAGVGLGAALIPQYAQALIGMFGWRGAYVGLGALTFVLAIPAVAFLVREPDRALASETGEPPKELPGVTGRAALKTKYFWLLVVPFFALAAAANGSIAHVVPLLTDRGVSPQMATSALTMAGLALIAGRLLAGYLLDRLFAPYVAVVFIIIPLIGIVMLTTTSSTAMASLATVLIGLGLGAEVDLIAFFISRYLGLRSFGEIYGYLFAIFMLANGIGPYVMGVSFDKAGSYVPVLWTFAGGLVVASVLILLMGPYVYPSRHELARRKLAVQDA
ncbi:MFS transporter [Rhodoplanes sp. TEM]|uniref:MFS transporter n=1 Tax=Rhodoplanes tepidamans TaxID=200616 RepID=A0ABT5JBQ5_RHOTP|nr:MULTISPECIES: MFS transporter [Rhodoplanes]MDC7787064.1 MFS transporter [Rhodoplanes tepidamans]MDC7987765.1 MFS transporter [Rhodoplanes sp. TEM]MDQ0359047.1 MFS family permease [Rhodoplanes tepidamans]